MSQQHARPPVVFPAHQRVLAELGNNIRCALARRQISLTTVQQRTGLPMSVIHGVLAGEPTVAMGHYVMLLSQIRHVDDLAEVARDQDLVDKLAAIDVIANASPTGDSVRDLIQAVARDLDAPLDPEKGNLTGRA